MQAFLAAMICWLPFTGTLRLCDSCDVDDAVRMRVAHVLSGHDCPIESGDLVDRALAAGAYCDTTRTHHSDPALAGVWTTTGYACFDVGMMVGAECKPALGQDAWVKGCEGL